MVVCQEFDERIYAATCFASKALVRVFRINLMSLSATSRFSGSTKRLRLSLP